jgi:hypothetical protein
VAVGTAFHSDQVSWVMIFDFRFLLVQVVFVRLHARTERMVYDICRLVHQGQEGARCADKAEM